MERINIKIEGSVFLITIFAVAFVSALVMGMLHMNIEEIQLAQNHIYAAEALAIAEAGLNDAFAELRVDADWRSGFAAKSFKGGSYDVNVTGSLPTLVIQSIGASSQGFIAKVEADVTLSSNSPYVIRIDNLRINE